MSVRDKIIGLRDEVSKSVLGQDEMVEKLLLGLLANGNLLVEGLPGAAKTRGVNALAKNLEGTFGRIQFTPDLISSDITGKEIIHHPEDGGKPTFKFAKGPIFNNIVLADEINRAPSKTQNALLEAMEERQVTVSGQTYKMPDIFLVMGTQNPSSQEGTFPLPEAQMDRFLLHLNVEYPDEETESQVIRLVRGEQSQESRKKEGQMEKEVVSFETILSARGEIDVIPVPDYVEKYMIDLVFSSRFPQRYNYELKSYLRIGISPRGSLALDRTARAYSWLHGKDHVDIAAVQAVVKAVFRHRLGLSDRAKDHDVHPDEIIDDMLELVRIPEPGEKAENYIDPHASHEAAKGQPG